MTELTKAVKALEKLVSEEGEPLKIRTASERVLSLDANHLMALQCKTVSYIYQDKYGAALQVLEQMEKAHKDQKKNPTFLFQKAYCFYRTQQYSDAEATLLQCDPAQRTSEIKHLLAQTYYNEENYQAATTIYEELLRNQEFRDAQDKAEITTNYTAALAMQKESSKVMEVVRNADSKDADLLYNCATAQIESQSDYEAALKTLTQAESRMAQTFKESRVKSIDDALALSPEERQNYLGGSIPSLVQSTPERRFLDEVSNIWAQMAYVYHQTQQVEKCIAILDLILDSRPSSGTVTAICAVNRTAVDQQRDFFDSLKRLKAAQSSKYLGRLTSRQVMAIYYNTALLYLRAGNLSRCKKEVERMEKLYPKSTLTQTLRLVLNVKENRKKQSDASIIQNFLKKYEEETGDAVNAQLIAAQIFLDNNDLSSAVTALSAVEEVRLKPCATTTLFSWRVQAGEESEALQLLQEYVERSAVEDARGVLAWCVEYLLRRQQYSLASDFLQSFVAKTPKLSSDPVVVSLLALSLSFTDGAKSREIVAKLPSAKATLQLSLTDAEVDDLEAKVPSRTAVEELGYRRATTAEESKKKGTRRRRVMRRPPKSMEGRIDPERWLPISVRSYIKDLPPKRKREMKRQRAFEQEQKRRQAQQKKKEAESKTSETF